jgi:hypothetical protein
MAAQQHHGSAKPVGGHTGLALGFIDASIRANFVTPVPASSTT